MRASSATSRSRHGARQSSNQRVRAEADPRCSVGKPCGPAGCGRPATWRTPSRYGGGASNRQAMRSSWTPETSSCDSGPDGHQVQPTGQRLGGAWQRVAAGRPGDHEPPRGFRDGHPGRPRSPRGGWADHYPSSANCARRPAVRRQCGWTTAVRHNWQRRPSMWRALDFGLWRVVMSVALSVAQVGVPPVSHRRGGGGAVRAAPVPGTPATLITVSTVV